MTNDYARDLRTDRPASKLTEDQLANVSGGHKAVATRDAVSGNATGRRAY